MSQGSIYSIFEKVPARLVLYILSWSGIAVSFIMRSDINFTIVAMVRDPEYHQTNETIHNIKRYCYDINTTTSMPLRVTNYGGTLEWDATVQSHILASFYWSYIIFQLVGGQITHIFGTKRVFGYAQLVTALCSLSVPWASDTHYGIVIFLRILQGCASGLTWPALYSIVGHWIPTSERSRFLSAFQGCNIGIGLTYPLCGYIIASHGWRSVFYTTGSIGLIWCVIWYMLVFDSPETHPRISKNEQQYIRENTINTHGTVYAKSVPWFKIITSLPVWAMSITAFGRIWLHSTFMIPGPQYMKNVLGFSIEKNGLLSGAPFISSYFAALFFCYVADKIVAKRCVSLGCLRKIFTGFSQVLPAVLLFLIPYLECNVFLILVCWFVALMFITSAFGGVMANPVDISPNFSGPVLGVVQFISMIAGFLSTQITMYINRDGQTLATWRTVFHVSAIIAILSYFVYLIFGNSNVQEWNNDVHTTEYQMVDQDEVLSAKSSLKEKSAKSRNGQIVK